MIAKSSYHSPHRKRGCMEGQFSIFDYIDSEMNIHISPVEKKADNETDITAIVHEILIEDILNGTGFENGKFHVWEMYQDDIVKKDRIDRIKNLYGIGGHSLRGEYFQRGFQNHDAKGIEIELDNVKYLFSWEKVEKIIHGLVDSRDYYKPKEYKAPQIQCLGKECNHDVLIEVAKGLGYECKTDCFLKCNARFCGARCNYSVRYIKG